MKVLFDTNVLIAAFLTRGLSNEVFEHCLSEHTICTSEWILDELEGNLKGKLKFPPAKAENIVLFLRKNTLMAATRPLKEKACRDPDDDNVLSAALAVEADCIISGDGDLLTLQKFRGIRIISPSGFWEFEAKGR
ncbi:MAG: putative toxin-antitoxin system toxin component, PIN family [Deltaproteobacteria bacterium]|nr:putative toxin-antitoxin system toxin component, PIN family [Deltaproteobacteria bacterium]